MMNTPVIKLSRKDFNEVFDKIHNKGQYAQLGKTIGTIRAVVDIAVDDEIIEFNPVIEPTRVAQKYRTKGNNHSSLNPIHTLGLIELLQFLSEANSKAPVSANMLIFTMLVPLRASNIRYLTKEQIIEIDNKSYIEIDGGKYKGTQIGDMGKYFAIHPAIEKWLKSIYNDDKKNVEHLIFFSDDVRNKNNGVASENTTNNFLANFKSKHIKGAKSNITNHSFRSIMSSYMNELGHNSRDIELALGHKIKGIEKEYNHSTDKTGAERALIAWYEFLKKICIENDINLEVFNFDDE